MGKTYFVMSDLHSFYYETIEALNKVGFDLNNPDHIFVLCGDLFDRGDGTLELLDFIRNKIPKERRILIRGNHEYLLLELVNKHKPEDHDFSNGTVKTCYAFKHINFKGTSKYSVNQESWAKVLRSNNLKSVIKWIHSDEWVNYFELGRFIFVHSFIPLSTNSILPAYYLNSSNFTYIENWRTNSNCLQWEDATWGCPWRLFKSGLFNKEIEKGKCLVVGHWHTPDFHYHLSKTPTLEDVGNYEMYYSDNLIALDACTTLTRFCNVLVIEENNNKFVLKDRHLKELGTFEM